MWIWLGGIGLLFAVLIAAVLISNVHVHFTFNKHKSDDYANINVRLLYGIVRINYEIPSIVFRNMKEGFLVKTEQSMNHSRGEAQGSERVNKRKVKKWAKDVKIMLRATDALKLWLKQTLTRVHMTRLSWATHIGVGDAAYTAVLTGWVWSIKAIIIGFLTYQIRFDKAPVLQVMPVWSDEMEFRTELDCRVRIRITALLIAGITSLPQCFKLKVDGGCGSNFFRNSAAGVRRSKRKRKSLVGQHCRFPS